MNNEFRRIKDAWDSPDREITLNRVVKQMAAEKVRREDLDAALALLLHEVRSTGVGDDIEEVINTLADRLHG